jgi:predicted MFS family arabinose efflux permease
MLADRYSRRKILIGLLTSVALLGALLSLLTATGHVDANVLLIMATLRGIAFACEIPVRHAFLSDLVPDRAVLPNAVALHSSALNTARFIGPAVGGLLIGSFGEATCFMLHPILLIATLYQLLRIRTVETPHPSAGSTSFMQQYLDGWRFAFSDPTIARLLVAIFLMGFAVGPYAHLMPAAVAEIYGKHPELVGFFLSAAGVGAMVAAISMAVRRGSQHLSLIALGGNLAAAVGLLMFSRSSWMTVSIIGMVLVGGGVIAQAIATNITIQTSVPNDKRGRVLAIYTAMFLGATPFGSLAFGQLGQSIGAGNALLAGGLIAMAGVVLTAFRMRESGAV